jgi:hypothetical protein
LDNNAQWNAFCENVWEAPHLLAQDLAGQALLHLM